VAKPNYSFEKRQRELAKKKKKEEKASRKANSAPDAAPDDARTGDDNEAPAAPAPGDTPV
jgi:hypothetical protein